MAVARSADIVVHGRADGDPAAPTSCLAGERDQATPPAVVPHLAERIPGARCSTAAVGPLPCVERPEAGARRITSFIEETGLG